MCEYFFVANSKNHAYLSDQEILSIVIGLCEKISGTSSVQDAIDMLSILFTPQEIRMVAIRLRICELILLDYSYKEISTILHVSGATISRTRFSMETHNIRPTEMPGAEFKQPADYNKPYRRSQKAYTGAYREVFWPIETLGNVLQKYFESRPPPRKK